MDPSTTTQLITRNRCRGHGQDRISQLPDPIVHHILGFLPIRDAVQSSVLAKRWRNQWASMPCLDFTKKCVDESEDFVSFIDAVLMLRKPWNVDTFTLDWVDGSFNQSHAGMWIVYAINHNVRVLKLSIATSSDSLELPHCLMSCQSLEELHVTLDVCLGISCLRFADFSRLKKLYFLNVDLFQDVLSKLISGCPLIEDLHLEGCHLSDNGEPCLYISSQTMKHLMIYCCNIHSKIQFSIPSLISLQYKVFGFTQVTFVNLSSLVYASISDWAVYGPKQPRNVVKLINQLSNAKILNLSDSWIECLSEKELLKFPTFRNLERLIIEGCCANSKLKAVAYFLHRSPNLEHLTLKEPTGPKYCTHVPQSVPNLSFNCPRLKIIEIRCSKTSEMLLDLVKTLLTNSKALQKIVIIPR